MVTCSGEEALHRAKSLMNLQFSWFLIGIAVFGVTIYLVLIMTYGQKVEYFSVFAMKHEEIDGDQDMDVKERNIYGSSNKSLILSKLVWK